MNLLNNAYDAVQSGTHSWIEIAATTENNILKISITDSGSGISQSIQDKIMMPFFTTKEVGKGTGLGLSISQGIIEEHGGKLYFDPSSKNTRFTIELPIHHEQ
jgi:signal transduction histidine kinase